MMCEINGRKLAIDNVLGAKVPMELDQFVEKTPSNESPEAFDLYEWALDFSRAAGFEFDRVD